MPKENIEKFLRKNKIFYKDKSFYITAFSHSSYVNEHKAQGEEIESYERLEFLGDSVLGKIVSEFIFKKFRHMSPGEMSLLKAKVVSKTFLSMIGKRLELEKYVLFSGTENNQQNISDSIYEDFIEALIAAIYLDLGEKAAEMFVSKHITSNLKEFDLTSLKDHKTKLQELLQSSDRRKSVEYKLVKSFINKNNERWFKVNVYFDGQILATGEGKNKKAAEQEAASLAYSKMVVS